MISCRGASTSAMARASIPCLPVRKIFKAESKFGERGPPLHVEFFVVLLIFAALRRVHPLHVAAVPLDGMFQSRIEVHRRSPAEFATDFRVVEGVPAIMAGPILDKFDQAIRLVEQSQEAAHNSDV